MWFYCNKRNLLFQENTGASDPQNQIHKKPKGREKTPGPLALKGLYQCEVVSQAIEAGRVFTGRYREQALSGS